MLNYVCEIGVNKWEFHVFFIQEKLQETLSGSSRKQTEADCGASGKKMP